VLKALETSGVAQLMPFSDRGQVSVNIYLTCDLSLMAGAGWKSMSRPGNLPR
jgi:hypothetical protein